MQLCSYAWLFDFALNSKVFDENARMHPVHGGMRM